MSREWRLGGIRVPAGTVAEFVFRRDGECMAYRFEVALGVPFTKRHSCTFRNSRPLGGPTLEHVTSVHSHLDGRKDDERHTVALCATLNGLTLRLATHAMKEFFREHLRSLYPACSG